MELADPGPGGGLAGKRGAELGLTTRAPNEQDEVAGHLKGRAWTEILLDERQREIDSGGDAGRGVDIAVAHEDRVRIDLDRRVSAGEGVARGPVRRRAAAVEAPR